MCACVCVFAMVWMDISKYTDIALFTGSDVECRFHLMSFGISSEQLPIQPDGTVSKEAHVQWLQRRQALEGFSPPEQQQNQQEESESTLLIPPPSGMVLVPGPYDVLLGRGRFIQDHAGNIRFRSIAECHRKEYESVSKMDKKFVAATIVQLVKEGNGRFLRQEGPGWVEVDDATAREKVSHLFRNSRSTKGPPRPSHNGNPIMPIIEPVWESRPKQVNYVEPEPSSYPDAKRARHETMDSQLPCMFGQPLLQQLHPLQQQRQHQQLPVPIPPQGNHSTPFAWRRLSSGSTNSSSS